MILFFSRFFNLFCLIKSYCLWVCYILLRIVCLLSVRGCFILLDIIYLLYVRGRYVFRNIICLILVSYVFIICLIIYCFIIDINRINNINTLSFIFILNRKSRNTLIILLKFTFIYFISFIILFI